MGIVDQLTDAVAALPGVRITTNERRVRVEDHVFAFGIVAEIDHQHIRLLVHTQAHGYPRDVRNAIWQTERFRRLDQPVPDIPLVAAPAITETARTLLRERHLGYWDNGGSLFLELPQATYRVDHPVPSQGPRILQSPFTGHAARVVRLLLRDPEIRWQVSGLAEYAGVSVSTAHQVCRSLEARGWLVQDGRGPRSVRRVVSPGEILDAWAAAHSLGAYEVRRFRGPVPNTREFFQRVTETLERQRIRYALTLNTGFRLLLRAEGLALGVGLLPVSVLTLSDVGLAAVVQELELQPVTDGETIAFHITEDRWPLTGLQMSIGSSVASDLQLYLDLSAWPERGKEFAAKLRAERLGY